MEVLTDSNIREYVAKYFENPSLYPPITNWDVSLVTNMHDLFSFRDTFNEPLNWDVSNVTNMSNMFFYCSSFNASLTWEGKEWIVSKVTNMSRMFCSCREFNQNIGNWDVSNVNNMELMFFECHEFNNLDAPLNWTVSNVRNMSRMFRECNKFNQNIGNWEVSNVMDMSFMFGNCNEFNNLDAPLNWTVSSVRNMSGMFNRCYKFNQNIENWDVSNVTNMFHMFDKCWKFNQNIGNWEVSKVTDMSNMFDKCGEFNQNIGNWKVSNVMDMSHMFEDCNEFNNLDAPLNWTVSSVRNMSEMFKCCYKFNQNIGNWDVSNVTNMEKMFSYCESFDKDLSGWNTISVINNEDMFENAIIRTEYKPKIKIKSKEDRRQELEQTYESETERDRGIFGHEWNDTTKEYRLIFSDYLKEKKIKYLTEVKEYHQDKDLLMLDNEMLWELGLNCRYGVELEFTHASLTGRTTRFVLGNRINNCIISHNPKEFYSHRFDLKSSDSILTQQKQISPITPDKNFDEWSNFLIEVMSEYHASTHDRVPTDNDNGRALSGFKIEKDGGVLYNGVFATKKHDEYSSDGVLEKNGERIYHKDYTLTKDREDSKVTIWKNGEHQIDSKIIRMTSYDASIDIVNVKDVMNLFENISVQTELVTPILLDEPFKIGDVYYPYGIIALENIIQHMTHHSNVLFVQNDGLHIHISKNLNDGPLLSNEIIGFIKLFWVFEPLFLAGEPTYRSENEVGGYRSLQSIFSYHEILNNTQYKTQFDVLTDIDRYVSLNVMNLVPSGIGTFEYRIGHGTFDGKAIQLHTHLLQVLFQFNLSLIKIDPDFKYHNQLIRTIHAWNGVPEYTLDYNTDDYKEDYEKYHFFDDSTTIDDKSHIILTLAKCFATSTGAVKGITALLDYIELYHTLCQKTSDPTGFPEYYTHNLNPIKPKWMDWLGTIDTIESIKFHHFEIPKSNINIGIDDPREACSDENQLYNDGLPLTKIMNIRGPGDVMNVKHQFLDMLDDENHGKIQTELLNSKLKGGRRTKVKRKRTRRQKHEKQTRNVPKRTFRQTAGLNDLKHRYAYAHINELKPNVKMNSNIVTPKVEYAIKDSRVKQNNGVKMNRYLDYYDLNVDFYKMLDYTIIISSPCKFTEMSNINVRLSHVASSIIDKKIININQLNILVKLKYIDSFLYLKEPNCLDELIEIESLKMTPDIFNQIKAEYKRIYSTRYEHNHIFLDLNKYLKTGETSFEYS